MNVTCNDRDRIFEGGSAAEWEALEAHAASCAQCAEEVRAWKSLSIAAQELQDYSPSPSLWPRIERALAEEAAGKVRRPVRKGETVYEKAIDKLAAEAKPQLEDPATPLLANYHEKLLVLDSAISDLREQAGLNPSNAQLRYQLLAMYQEKQRTLEEVVEAKRQ